MLTLCDPILFRTILCVSVCRALSCAFFESYSSVMIRFRLVAAVFAFFLIHVLIAPPVLCSYGIRRFFCFFFIIIWLYVGGIWAIFIHYGLSMGCCRRTGHKSLRCTIRWPLYARRNRLAYRTDNC